jgi:hypothetical protein
MKKLTLESIKNEFIKKDYILLIDSCDKLLAKTEKGYCIEINYDNMNFIKIPTIFHMNNPHTINNIKLWLKLNNKPFELISNDYKRAKSKLQWKCLKENCGEIFEADWNAIKQNCGCPYCCGLKVGLSNRISTTHPYLIKYFKNPEDANKYSKGSKKRVLFKCPNCEYEKEMIICDFIHQNFLCHRCGDGISYPEKFIFNMLEQLNIKFIYQLSKKNYGWCDKYKYDFYIPSLNCIVETHGMQHYKNKCGNWGLLEDIQKNDELKKQLAIQNQINYYVVVNCSDSTLNSMKNSIQTSELSRLLNFNEEDIDWIKCGECACKSNVKLACDLWNSGIKSTLQIAKELKVQDSAIVRYLKRGNELNLCSYDATIEKDKNREKLNMLPRKIICLNDKIIFDSIYKAGKYYNINSARISECCQRKRKHCNKRSFTQEPLQWMYYEDYLTMQQNNLTQIEQESKQESGDEQNVLH